MRLHLTAAAVGFGQFDGSVVRPPQVSRERYADSLKLTMKPEQRIEDQVIANLEWLGYKGSPWIRRAKLGREGFGFVDLLILPTDGPHRLVLVEVKHEKSPDTPGRFIGQALAYYLAALRLGSDGLNRLRKFASEPGAHDARGKSVQELSGIGRGQKPKDVEALRAGAKVRPEEVALLVVLGREDGVDEQRESLKDLRDWLKTRGNLDIRVLIARQDGSLQPCM
jgi:hypothetical protein